MTPPYTPLEMLRAMQRDWYEKTWDPFNGDDRDRAPRPREEQQPDPLGLALMKLRPIDAVRTVLGRAGSVGRPRIRRTRRAS